MKKRVWIFAVSFIFIAAFFAIYPHIEIKTENTLIALRYSSDISEFDAYGTVDETYFYNKKYDISVYDFDIKNFLFFHKITMKYRDGDMRKERFLLKAEEMDYVLKNWQITENEDGIDVEKMLENKRPNEENKRYPFETFSHSIYYVLDGQENVMHIGKQGDNVIIQIGNSDEGPKYISYK